MFFSLTFAHASKSLKSCQRKTTHTVLNATVCKYQFIKWCLTIVLREIWYVCPRLNLGVKTKKNDQNKYVYQVWCKISAANKDKVYRHQAVKGATKTAAEHFINGTNFVTKHSVS